MRRLAITVQTLSPVAIGYRSAHGHFMESHDYIPGSAFRGALAAEVLRHCPDRQPNKAKCPTTDCPLCSAKTGRCLFGDVFSDETGLVFGSLFPVAEDGVTQGCLLGPTPATLRVCKQAPGGRAQWRLPSQPRDQRLAAIARASGEPHGVWDVLTSHVLHPATTDSGVPASDRCSEASCGADAVAPGQPFCRFVPDGMGRWELLLIQPRRQRFARVAIDRARHAAQDEMLYSVGCIPPGTHLTGTVAIPDGMDDEAWQHTRVLFALLRGAEHPLLLGGGVSRGLGRVAARLGDDWRSPLRPIADRLASFCDGLGAGSAETWFTVTLTGHAIIGSPGTNRGTVGISAPWLAARLASRLGPGARIDVLAAYQGPTWITGWNAAWGLPKWTELGTAMGSVWAFRLFRPVDQQVIAALEDLEKHGVGRRTREGYGQLIVCHPAHWGSLS